MSGHLDFLTGKWIEKPERKRTKKLPEAQVGDAVDAYLCSVGAYVRAIKSDGRKLPNGKWIPSKQGRGISDRLVWLPEGVFLAVELKAQGKKRDATVEQLDFLRRIIKLGHRGCVADSVECVKLALAQTKSEMLGDLDKLIKKEYSQTNLSLEPLF